MLILIEYSLWIFWGFSWQTQAEQFSEFQLKHTGLKMAPFTAAVGVYFYFEAYKNHGKTWATFLKCAPIVCLMLFILLHGIASSKRLRQFYPSFFHGQTFKFAPSPFPQIARAQNTPWIDIFLHWWCSTQSQYVSTRHGRIRHCSNILHSSIRLSTTQTVDRHYFICRRCGG